MMSEQLKPCPFCGKKPEIGYEDGKPRHFFVHCPDCLASMNSLVPNGSTVEDAIAAWNRRQEAKPCDKCSRKKTAPTACDPCGPPAWESFDWIGFQAQLRPRHEEAKPLTVEQVGWKWIKGQSTDEYTCGHQPYVESEKDWFLEHKWEPTYIIHAALPPDQSARIAELVEVLETIEKTTQEMARQKKQSEGADGDFEFAYDWFCDESRGINSRVCAALARIKAGQS